MDLNPQRRIDDFLTEPIQPKHGHVRMFATAAYARLLAAQARWRAAQRADRDPSGEVKTMTRGFDWS